MRFNRDVIVLVGLMGAGKTRVGSDLARLLKVPFVDADREIEAAAGLTIPDIFEQFGEQAFRDGERKVIHRLLRSGAMVLASGGGAFIQDSIRKDIKDNAISVWLKADLDTLIERTSRTSHRPLLQNTDPALKLKELMDKRYPIYAEADLILETDKQSPLDMAKKIKQKLEEKFLKS